MNDKAEKPKQDIEIADPCIVPKEWNIWQRMNWVRSQVSYIQKDKSVSTGGAGSYKAVTHDSVTGWLRPFLIKAGVVTTQTLTKSNVADSGSTTQKGIPIIRYEATYLIGFHNVQDMEQMVSIEIEAHALDQGDKAPGKAMSYAKKYAYLKGFDIETGEDEESRIEQKAAADIEADKEAFRLERLNTAIADHMDTIQAIKTSIKDSGARYEGNNLAIESPDLLSAGAEAWFELTNDEKASIWSAPSKGGPFTTDERKIMKSNEFNRAYYGDKE